MDENRKAQLDRALEQQSLRVKYYFRDINQSAVHQAKQQIILRKLGQLSKEEQEYYDRRAAGGLGSSSPPPSPSQPTPPLPSYPPAPPPPPPPATLRLPGDGTPLGSLAGDVWRIGKIPTKSGWHLETAYVMARLSEIAYWKLTEFEIDQDGRYKVLEPSIAREWQAKNRVRIDVEASLEALDLEVRVIERDRFLYLTASCRDFAIIAVRGTRPKSIRDWLIDLDAQHAPMDDGHYHMGFAKEAFEALPQIEQAVGTSKRIYFTGHSLGAAVASVLSQMWIQSDRVAPLYVFASPRFASKTLANSSRRFMVQKPLDPVPHLPPRIFGYSDAGSERLSLPEGTYRNAASTCFMLLGKGIKAHSIEGIREELGAMTGEHFAPDIYIQKLLGQN